MNEHPLIQVEGVSREFKVGSQTITALRDVSLTIGRGDFLAIIGRSGSGKTTLLNVIAGLDRPTKGRVIIDGEDISIMNEGELTEMRRRKIGFVFQSFGLLPLLSAYENVELALRIGNAGIRERGRRTNEVLELVGLTRRAHHRPYELSGGEQQRVAIARALANRPAIILADEPTGELDSMTATSIFQLLVEVVRTENVTIVTTTHDLLVIERAKRVVELADGALLPEPTHYQPLKREAVEVTWTAPAQQVRRLEEEAPATTDDEHERWSRPGRSGARPIYQPPRSPREPL